MITVIDSIMGSGKTTWAINHINQNPRKHFLYISPLISEDNRIEKSCPGAKFYVPKEIENIPKLPRVKAALRKKQNVASTHALFKNFDEECLDILREGRYTLIMDEVIEVVNLLDIKKDDIDIIMNSEAAIVDERYKMIWTDKYSDLSERGYKWIEDLIKLDKIINVDNQVLMWQFPPEMFDVFQDTYILTYMFESNLMYNYFNINGISYQKKSLKDGKIADYYVQDPKQYTDLINIYDGKLNTNIYHTDYTLSYSWYSDSFKNNRVYLDRLKNNLYNYFHHITKSKSSDAMWTVFKPWRNNLKGKGYTKGFVPVGCRGTNQYQNKKSLAYCVNRFHNPIIMKYFTQMGYPLDQQGYALSDLLQWMWRSSIRKSEPINVYIPSPRMRKFFYKWAETGSL